MSNVRPVSKLIVTFLFVLSGIALAGTTAPLRQQACQIDSASEQLWPNADRDAKSAPLVAESLAHEQRQELQVRSKDAVATRIGWAEAKQMILRGHVTVIEQSHNREVLLRTERGTVYATIEPKIDEVFIVASFVDPCNRFIRHVTE